jgi:hypothetical protein
VKAKKEGESSQTKILSQGLCHHHMEKLMQHTLPLKGIKRRSAGSRNGTDFTEPGSWITKAQHGDARIPRA